MPDPVAARPAGLVVIDKPPGVSSRRVVDVVARALGTPAVGHAGTLDPLARGVMLVCVGHATRLVESLHDLPKRYEATFLLGRSSPSDDLETPVVEEADPVPPGRAAVEAALGGFRGEILQRPCDYSAAHVAGRRAYRLARAGRAVDLAEKRVRIDELTLTGYAWPQVDLDVVCSSGTFIRALGRDLALALGTRAVMTALVRTAVGPFGLDRATPLEAIDTATARDALLPPLAAVPGLPRVVLAGDLLDRAARGGLVAAAEAGVADAAAGAATFAAVDPAGDLVGLLRAHPGGAYRLRPNFRGVG
jgi:tRNA pseudouridine55 synthase